MKSEQIKLVLAIETEQSISKAADKLFISQPTASNMLRALENDLGYQIFIRNHNGVELTNEGSRFIEYARILDAGFDAAYRIKEGLQKEKLTVLAYQYKFAEEAFASLCQKSHASHKDISYKFKTINSTEESFRMVAEGQGDIAVVICRQSLLENYKRRADKLGLEIEQIGEMHLELSCKQGHPIINKGLIDYSRLNNYPCFSSVDTGESNDFISSMSEKHGKSLNNIILLGPGNTRSQLIADMNGYLISTPLSADEKQKYNLESIVIEDSHICVFALYLKGLHNMNAARNYIEELKRKI